MLKGDYLKQIIGHICKAETPIQVTEQLLSVISALLTQLKSQAKKKPRQLRELMELRDQCI
jgi:hypothetical protein